MQIEHGRRVRFCIAYQIQDKRDGCLTGIVRYGDAHGAFHRHTPRLPPSKRRTWLPEVAQGRELDKADLADNAEQYEAIATLADLEITDEDDEE
jgi:hypothetical protein